MSVFENIPDIRLSGYFMMKPDEYGWMHCRERIHHYIDRHRAKGFYFQCSGDHDKVKSIINKIEIKLQLKAEDCLKIHVPTDKDKFRFLDKKFLIFVELSQWWQHPVRINLLTLIVRYGCVAEKDDIESTIKVSQFLQTTESAVWRFLDGNVHFHKNHFNGWVTDFVKKENIDLLKKEPPDFKTLAVVHHSGWNAVDVDI